jgi:hypothetical protein
MSIPWCSAAVHSEGEPRCLEFYGSARVPAGICAMGFHHSSQLLGHDLHYPLVPSGWPSRSTVIPKVSIVRPLAHGSMMPISDSSQSLGQLAHAAGGASFRGTGDFREYGQCSLDGSSMIAQCLDGCISDSGVCVVFLLDLVLRPDSSSFPASELQPMGPQALY